MVGDKFRPRYHFLPPEGRWNDINGAIFWKGRYHLGYLQKIANGPGERDFSSWQHVSSRDLLHWRYHKASLREPLEGQKGDYFNSGDVMDNVEVPTIITNMPRRGICIYRCYDDNLNDWTPLAENPVIPLDAGPDGEGTSSTMVPECVIFDPSGWKEGDTYYALVGNKNHRPRYEGDSTSLFKSKDLRKWEYLGPFYKSDRKVDGGDRRLRGLELLPLRGQAYAGHAHSQGLLQGPELHRSIRKRAVLIPKSTDS